MVFLFTVEQGYQEHPAVHFAYAVLFKMLMNDVLKPESLLNLSG